MAKDFKKLSCYAKKVIIDKVSDRFLTIFIEDENGGEHNIEVNVAIENFQNIDTFGNKEGHTIDLPVLDINHTVKETEKISSENISMKWNHNQKPSVYEIKNKNEIVFTGSFQKAMMWVKEHVTEYDQKVVKKRFLN